MGRVSNGRTGKERAHRQSEAQGRAGAGEQLDRWRVELSSLKPAELVRRQTGSASRVGDAQPGLQAAGTDLRQQPADLAACVFRGGVAAAGSRWHGGDDGTQPLPATCDGRETT